jgi:hypothetical protein
MTHVKKFWFKKSAEAFATATARRWGLTWDQWDVVPAHYFGPMNCFSIGWKVRWVEDGSSLDVSK